MITPRPSSAVADAQRAGQPIVALESTIFSNLGLPSPDNEVALERCLAAVTAGGAVPAVTAMLEGEVRLGLDDYEYPRILGVAQKMAERDIPVAVAQGWEIGASTVSASVAIAAAGGVSVFATGGIGGVHRGLGSFDVSADLDAIAHHRVVTVSAGAKAFLDLGKTLEYLETAGVPVLGWRHDDFPAFYSRSSGFGVAHRVESADEVAGVFTAATRVTGGVLLAAPIPEHAALDRAEIDAAIASALDAADAAGVVGAAVTPYVLERIAAVTEGRSVPANLALAENNAGVAAEIAVAIAQS
ncbi:MAG: pseudouridine-5'-phosphate glycosidase [Actinomycetota bacterium]